MTLEYRRMLKERKRRLMERNPQVIRQETIQQLEKYQCSICLHEPEGDDRVMFCKGGHAYCHDCVEKAVATAKRARGLPKGFKCASCDDWQPRNFMLTAEQLYNSAQRTNTLVEEVH